MWDDKALAYVKGLGCTHIWFVGLIEHATTEAFPGIAADPEGIVKGKAGSPYAIKDYYDIAPELADDPNKRMQEFEALIERVHASGLQIMIDFVPNHVARTYRSDVAPIGTTELGASDDKTRHFSPSNNFYYFPESELQLPDGLQYEERPARATGNDCFSPTPSANDWYETIKLNYGIDYLGGATQHFEPIPDTWERMLEILRFWASKGVDGFRCDMAEMVPPAFWAWAIAQLKKEHSLIFLAEIYQRERYGEYLSAGFDYLYDKVGVYDTMRAIVRGECSASIFDPVRDAVGSHQAKMCYFLENHDEQRFTSPFYAGNAQALMPALVSMSLSGTQPYLHYFAGELAEQGMDEEGFSGRDGRTTIFDFWSLASLRRLGEDLSGQGLHEEERTTLGYHRQILGLAGSHPVLAHGAYHGLNYLQTEGYDAHRLLSFVRYIDKHIVLVVVSFADETRKLALRLDEAILTTIGIEPNRPLVATNLLTTEKFITTLTARSPYNLELPPYGVYIVEMREVEA